jgi:5-methylcytosine-specific restriction enzyme subunit McrC
MTTAIPVQNIYYLLCYAWNKLDEQDVVEVDATSCSNIADLFAKVLISGTTHLFRRGLDRNYTVLRDETSTIRGKLCFGDSLKRLSFQQARAVCERDELSYDTPHNQILKTSLRLLAGVDELGTARRDELIGLYRRFHNISEANLSERVFASVQLHRNNRFYDFLLKVCQLLWANLLPTERKGKSKFRGFERDEVAMRYLFEEFVRNFYKKELCDFSVGRRRIAWKATALDEDSEAFLPRLETDIRLLSPNRQIIIDTKFKKECLQSYFDTEKLVSSNIYQMFTYVKNASADNVGQSIEGMLLYPTVSKEVNANYDMSGHRISVRTINLNQAWEGIHNDLLGLVSSSSL